jgi:hypothetical protein
MSRVDRSELAAEEADPPNSIPNLYPRPFFWDFLLISCIMLRGVNAALLQKSQQERAGSNPAQQNLIAEELRSSALAS